MVLINKLDSYLNAHQMESIDELSTLAAQLSVSAYQQGLMECSKIIVEMLKKRSFEVQIFSDDVAPIIVAERKGKSKNTLLFYNHYDVQRRNLLTFGYRRHLNQLSVMGNYSEGARVTIKEI